jgi:hypothetical protein
MPRYFFLDNGTTRLNSEGAELANLETAEQEVVLTCSEYYVRFPLFGLPWCLWVIDQPNEGRKTVPFMVAVIVQVVQCLLSDSPTSAQRRLLCVGRKNYSCEVPLSAIKA